MASRAWGKRARVAAPGTERARLRQGRVARLAEALRAHEHRTAAGLFALFVLVYLWPVLVAGDVLSPGAVLYGVPPWQGSLPSNGVHFYNGLLSDVPLSYHPWNVLARELIHAGTFPAWNPHAFAGTPLWGNLSVAWLSPFSLPLWTLPLHYALGVAAALKLWAAAFGTYLLVRELRLGFWPGVLAGLSFALCAFNVVWLSHGAHVSVAVLLPWTIWLTERIVRRGGRMEGAGLALVVAAALAGGHPGTQLHVLSGTVLYALVRAAGMSGVAWSERGRRLATLGAGMVVGVLLMAVVLLPGERAAVDAIGVDARRDGGELIGATMPIKALLAAVFPDWWGSPSEAIIAGPANYSERAFYAGRLTLVLAVAALLSRGAWRRKAAFLPLAAVGLAVPLDAPLIRDLVVRLPAFDRVQNQRLLLWFLFAVAVLSAFGLQAALDAPRRQLRVWIVVAAAAIGGIAALRGIDLAPGDTERALHHLTDRFAAVTPGALALVSVIRWLLLMAVLAAALLLLRWRPRRRWAAGAVVALVAALDLQLFAHGYQPMGPASIVIPPRTPAVAFLEQHTGDERIGGLQNSLTADWSTTYGLRDIRGYDAPQPSRRYFRLWQAINPGQVAWRPFEIPDVAPETLPALGMLGARYLITSPNIGIPEQAGFGPLSHAYRGSDATIFENALAAPRALVAERVHVAADIEEEVATVARVGFDPRRHAVLRADEAGADPPPGVTGGSVHVTAEENARVTLRARLPRRGLVVLGDAWAPGWSVTVDGRPARALQADVVMRGVVVPAGTHEVEWSYRVPGLRTGALLSLFGALALVGWTGWIVRARRAGGPRPVA